MVSNISFTSTYKVSNQNNGYDRFSSFQDLALEKETEPNVGVTFKDGYETGYPFSYNQYVAKCILSVPDKMDNEIETYCRYNGINYSKYTNQELFNLQGIENRIEEPSKGMKLAKINSEKLDSITPTQYSNFDHCESDYTRYYKEAVDLMIKSGETIPAATLSIMPDSFNAEDTVEYIKRNGADALEYGQLFIYLTQQTNQPDHCLYFALRDLGMKNIPVYLDEDSYNLADAMGILEQ